MTDRLAILVLQSWAGRTEQRVRVVGETERYYEISPVGEKHVRLAGRLRHLRPGETALVPRTAIQWP